MNKNNRKNKGFTLVELVVVMVIIGVLAAVMVPALMSYMDKQKREQVVMNAKDCLMSAQTLSGEQYTYGKDLYNQLEELNTDVGNMTKLKLTGSDKEGAITYVRYGAKGKDLYTIHEFRYTENGITAVWKRSDAKWIYSDEEDIVERTGIENGASQVADNGGNSGNSGNSGNNNPSTPPTSEEPTSEEPISEEPTTEAPAPTTEAPTTEEPTTETPVINANIAGGELVITVDGEDIATGKMIKDSDFWPSSDIMHMEISIREANYDYGYWNEYIDLKAGDIILYNDLLYIINKDYSISYGNAADGLDVVASNSDLGYALDYRNVITKKDFINHFGTLVYNYNKPGTLYFDEEENILFAISRQGDWFVEPSKDSHEGWLIVKDLNESNQE